MVKAALYIAKKGAAVIIPTGKVITAYLKSGFDSVMQSVVKNFFENGRISMYISKIKEIIIAWDPIDLICSGAPDNEYDYEISQIANSINDKITINTLAKKIYEVFSDSFGKDTFNNSFNDCVEIAIKCLNVLDE